MDNRLFIHSYSVLRLDVDGVQFTVYSKEISIDLETFDPGSSEHLEAVRFVKAYQEAFILYVQHTFQMQDYQKRFRLAYEKARERLKGWDRSWLEVSHADVGSTLKHLDTLRESLPAAEATVASINTMPRESGSSICRPLAVTCSNGNRPVLLRRKVAAPVTTSMASA
ncbi:MAG: hypothetical protein SF029_14900, partial [bacterium]|nr:hypothetical protein [bacterium]